MIFKSLLILSVAVCQSAFAQDKLTVVYPKGSHVLYLQTLKSKIKPVEVTTHDPVYETKKTFVGFPLKDVLALAGPIPEDSDEVSFVALDGYAPSLPSKEVFSSASFIVFAEKGKNTLPKKGKTILAPFYLVWEKEGEIPHHYPRPYQLARIEFVKFKEKFGGMYPAELDKNETEKRGFIVFKNNCNKCHTINGVGGTMGPELNYPKNITEYWIENQILEFIKNPAKFRARSQMPPVDKLKENELNELMAYLRFMKSHR